MKPSLAPGLIFTRHVVVDRGRAIEFMGEAGQVYATPALVRDVEVTCREGLLAHLEESEDSVGARIELDHKAPTLVGMEVDISATITEVKGPLVVFEVVARDPVDEIGRGKHLRYVIDKAKTIARLKAKAAKAACGTPPS